MGRVKDVDAGFSGRFKGALGFFMGYNLEKCAIFYRRALVRGGPYFSVGFLGLSWGDRDEVRAR